ncbi:MAG TPA: acyltransferase [Cyclobacteriaceae bacterium]|nr:acyltransferase [Cyclobacteriaceae bacterium]
MKQTIYFKGLNGLRAIAAIAVLFSHTTHALREFGLDSFVFGKYADGTAKTTLLAGFGVSIFFALSGFLITYLLLEEKNLQEINIRNFYIRRILRIWPLYYLYLILSILTLILFDLPFEKKSVLYYTFMLPNIPFVFGGIMPFVGHYWSLGVEEQFYAFWPWIVKKRKELLHTTILFCVSLFLLKFVLRFTDLQMNQGEMSWPYQMLHVTRFHCMLIGAIGAILYFQKNKFFIWLSDNIVTQIISWLVILLTAINGFHILSFLDNEFISIITVFIIIGQIQKTHRLINLDFSFFDFVGKISYGIYVIHPLVIFYLSKVIQFTDKSSMFNYTIVYFIVFLTTIITAYLSYHFFEKRFLQLKERYSTVSSSGTTL